MIPYYVDERKYLLRTKNPITRIKDDKDAGQPIHITGSISGITIRPGIRWTPLCEQVFRKTGANGVRLEEISSAPGGDLSFVNELPGCTRLMVEGGGKVDLAPLARNSQLEDLQISPSVRMREFDLTALPRLRRCQIPVRPELMSILKCQRIVSLWLNGGSYDGIFKLDTLPSLEEFFCSGVAKLKSVVLHPKVRLRSLELAHLKSIESVEPHIAITEELRVVQLNKVPQMKIEWLRHAEKLECIALRLGEIPTVKFLNGLKHLQVLDLFGSKVRDGDLSLRDSLKGELDSTLWSEKR
jgi:hypothetical protein